MQRTKYQAPILDSAAIENGNHGLYLDQNIANYHYGSKVAGLLILPAEWVPHFIALPSWLYEDWEASGHRARIEAWKRRGIDLKKIYEIVSSRGQHSIIVRSSIVGESIDDRGSFKSIVIKSRRNPSDIYSCLDIIFNDYTKNRNGFFGIGLCIQKFIDRGIPGHVSNEVRVSITRNQWKFEIERPYTPYQGLNSIFVPSPSEGEPLRTSLSSLSTTLRQVCHWVNDRVSERMHLEWVFAEGSLWVVQLDREAPTSAGVNPNLAPGIPPGARPSRIEKHCEIFTRYQIGTAIPWHKLTNVDDFWISSEKPKHQLFFATAADLLHVLHEPGSRKILAKEIDSLTDGHAVLRTDCIDRRVPAYNLPRTHTVSGSYAIRWIAGKADYMKNKGASLKKVAFILHRYIPARAAAWSFYEPGDALVRIDCLWGLPDGLQFLSHDSHQIDARTGNELSANIRFKPQFLQEQADGSWQYVRVARQFSRNRVLSREALRTIALQTMQIAERVHERAQVMWFCDVPSDLGLGTHLPWYRSKEYTEYIERSKLPPKRPLVIRTVADLRNAERMRDHDRVLRVEPAAELVRDDSNFLDGIVALARSHNFPIELSGSVLGHAYYKFVKAGLIVLTERPAHYRTRGRAVHAKLVRDSIPESIANKGELVRSARLSNESAVSALIGKLFEEGLELANAKSVESETEELSDVLEVLRGISGALGVRWGDVEIAAKKKREARGGFEKGVVLIETARPKSAHPPEVQGGEVISLAELESAMVEDNRATIPITQLLRDQPLSIEIPLRNGSIVLELKLDGSDIIVEITPSQSRDSGSSQLTLF